ncbi:MAG TPA: hypothetical protein VJ839_07650 [Candidatus Limnocylindria bacterium]|nr:hypothetical protein [Candidatus Limnocylindria bacterium]
MRKLLFALAAASAAAALTYRYAVRPWWKSWGVNPAEAVRVLPGDDVIPNANGGETRAITIDAPPAAVWPWLAQMGYGRAGWYSYDAMDMQGSSATRLMPEWQELKVGDVMPTHPGGGFVVSSVEPHRALVLYLDTDLVRSQVEAAKASSVDDGPANIRATGALLENTQPVDFSATWAFILDELPGGQTRLIERFRVRFGETDKPWTRFTLPFMGFGVFVMLRKQLLGIKERVESGAVPVEVHA